MARDRPRSNWVVAVHDTGAGDSEPYETGPYTEQRARSIADYFNRQRDGFGWFATAYPLQRLGMRELVKRHEPQIGPWND